MNIELEHVNQLPVRTWRWLNVNDRAIKEEIPAISPYKKESLKSRDFLSLGYTSEQSKELHITNMTKEENKNLFNSSVHTGMGKEAEEFIKMNYNSGISVRVPSGVRIEEPIFLQYELDEENQTVVDLNRIIAEDNSEVTVIMNYSSKKGIPAFHGGLTYLSAGKNAVIHLIQIQLLNEEAIHFNDLGIIVENEGHIDIVQAELGAGKAINGCRAELIGQNSNIDINTIYFGDKKRMIDFNYVVNHMGKYSQSDMKINGALLDESSKIFRGTIDFKRGAVGAVGHEEEYNLLFSPKIKNITAPLILCGEENVEGKHAANSGRMDDNKLFYMMSRGLDELSAKKLMIEAAFNPVINKIPFADLQEQISMYVKERLTHIESIS